ncbi:MAG: DUF3114 domain-containing protein [Streptococcus orisratti]|uniref:DUF3114 domain-containing protein n=1 Tax=Streptococcus orisratti TaxID=114652 RepID=UPI002354E232|nr:DUF3114 domain-containing protein [Streptococcus orisratti]MCI7677707.1 DUF3114 domain-containing protein [Streptococcus orisratti]
MLIGDEKFLDYWENSRSNLSMSSARDLLKWLMELVEMPAELTGNLVETRYLLNRFSLDLYPDHSFWFQLSQLVQVAFRNQSLLENTCLARQVHQFRYVISAFQAQWVRQHFSEKTDRQSLLCYLKGKKMRRFWRRQFDFDMTESSRLHNKLPKVAIEGYQLPVNMKIVMGFHTEFILDSFGRFANEIDPQGVSHNGIINGASFNYANANDKRHRELDILPISVHDPIFRKKILANDGNAFQAPKLARRKDADWTLSYFNKKGYFAKNGRSLNKEVSRHRKAFIKDLKKL